MVYLIDTNILLRFVDRTHPLHPIIRTAIRKLRRDGHTLQITVQNCVEFWNVATRPATKNGFGLTPTNALALRVDALALRVDALALRVDALALQVDALALQVDALALRVDALALQVTDLEDLCIHRSSLINR
ncbi:hypothetical protein [Nostoc sp.]|uniref:hypothetical protein n=1 Tax=Nostoc sp. TaxID=1180 RepID=UPI002FEEAEE4